MTSSHSDAAARLLDGLPPQSVVTDPETAARFCRDWTADYSGTAAAVLRPGSTEAVAEIVRRCAALGLSVVPQGGNTGLVGGGTPTSEGGEVVVSLERMAKVRSVDPLNFSMVVDAGCVLQACKTRRWSRIFISRWRWAPRAVARSAAMSRPTPAA